MRPAAAEIGLAASAARVSPSVDFADSSPVRERRDEVHPSPQQRSEAPLQEKALVRLGPGVFLPDGPAQPIGIFRAGRSAAAFVLRLPHRIILGVLQRLEIGVIGCFQGRKGFSVFQDLLILPRCQRF